MKSQKAIEARGLKMIRELKQVNAQLKEIDKFEFLSMEEERTKFSLIIRQQKLLSQIKLLGWILDV